MNVPVFIPTFNRVRALRQLVAWLERAGQERITFIDNASTYPPLLDYLEDTPHKVVRLSRNWGAHVLWDRAPLPDLTYQEFVTRERLRGGLQGPYAVTDPDCVPIDECPTDLIAHLSRTLDQHPTYLKAGPGFYLDDVPDHCPYIGHERQRQSWEIGPGAYDSAIDTTFALYKPGVPFVRRAIRTAFPYQVRHLCPSFYLTAPDDEDRYYHEHARKDASGSTWVRKTVLA